jgi:hypothetical protein
MIVEKQFENKPFGLVHVPTQKIVDVFDGRPPPNTEVQVQNEEGETITEEIYVPDDECDLRPLWQLGCSMFGNGRDRSSAINDADANNRAVIVYADHAEIFTF